MSGRCRGPSHGRRIVAGVQSMRAKRPSLSQAIVKLNEGVSGAGNAMVVLSELPAPDSPDEAAAIRGRVLSMQPESEKLAVDSYLAAFEKNGGIVEERITGEALTSPSVQMRALPDGTVELLSTHDQLLGGASGQKYLGCVFPANPDYAAAIAEPAMVIGRRLAELGTLGRVRGGFRCGTRRHRRVDALRHRVEPPQGWHHPSVPHPAIPHRRHLRRRPRGLPDAQRQQQVPGRDRPLRGRTAQGTDGGRSCSTSSSAMVCISIRLGGREWCST